MERLTTKVDNLYQTNDKFTPLLGIKRLGEYEDTGLTPEEIENLKDQSASDVAEVVHGEWLENDGRCYCNRCFEFSCTVTDDTGIIHNDLTKFCPNCGAKMDGGKANE